MENRFTIDFFEFSFLVEACIPPVPIARSMFWDNVINKYYHQMTKDERKDLYEWITKNRFFNIEKEEKCAVFEARYNPDNQYVVYTNLNCVEEKHETFLWKGRYHTKYTTLINEDFITKIEKIEG